MNGSGFVWLVGAGPGDPGLLTVRAYDLLRRATVVAHDELVSPAILALAPPSAERLAVGRRRGTGVVPYRVHPDVLARARAGHEVVRLKAGDPTVFGRGGEEAEELTEAGIAFAIVPGITAAAGAAAAAGIPLTHRDHADRAVFASGHLAGQDPVALAGARTTAVVYMASRRLGELLSQVERAGRSAATPAAFVLAATTPAEEVIVGTVGDLAERVALQVGAGDERPGLLIVGEVVGVRERTAANRRAAPPPPANRHPTRQGLLLVYTGQGKGKTTAALGLAFRALGRGLEVAVVQYIKGKWPTGERRQAAGTRGLTFLVMGEGFTWESDDLSRDRAAARAAWDRSRQLIAAGHHDVVILDELTYALQYGFLALPEVLDTLRGRPAHVSIVVTGRHAPPELLDLADLVTDMAVVKHPFTRGVRAQPGLDY